MQGLSKYLAVITLLAGCATEATTGQALTASVGPAGGILEGEAGTPFAGVRLEIPAGALAAETTISISETSDETPLPDGAERVGAQFRIEPAGTSLAVPATVQLPVDVTLRGALDANAQDVKVWARSGDTWALHEAVATTESTVTVELNGLGTVAAGVRIASTTAVSRCGVLGLPTCAAPSCEGTGRFCIQTMTPALLPNGSIHQRGNFIYYSANSSLSGNAGQRIVRLDVDSGAMTLVAGQSGPCNAMLAGPIAIDGEGNLWKGTCRFGFGAGRPAFQDFPLPTPVVSPGVVYRLAASGSTTGGDVLFLAQRRRPGGMASVDLEYLAIAHEPSGRVSSTTLRTDIPEQQFVRAIPDPTDATRVLMLGDTTSFVTQSSTASIVSFSLLGEVSRRVPSPANDLLTGFVQDEDGNFATLTQPVLSARGAAMLAVSPRFPLGRSFARLMVAPDGRSLAERSLGSIAGSIQQIVDAEFDSTGGIYMLARTGTFVASSNFFTDTSVNLFYLPSGASEPVGIPMSFRPVSLRVTDDDTAVIVGFPDGSSTRGLIRVRRL